MLKKRILCFVTAALFVFTMSAAAKELVPGGRALGIRMTTDGVVIADFTDLGAGSPAAAAGLKKGDIIVKLGSSAISTAEDFVNAVTALDGEKISVTVLRGGREKRFDVSPVSVDGKWRLGLMLRDGVSGVGTLTFFDPETGIYGALGHSISDSDSGFVLPLGSGSISDAEIVSIDKGIAGAPGALNGHAVEYSRIGDIRVNCESGIFGEAELDGKPIETGEIKTGKATIYCTLDGSGVCEYEIEIIKVYESAEATTVMLTVTDKTLLDKTGGIVQGMSGSPIIQDGRLVGAVTHVFLNDPRSGYGISIHDMLKQEANCEAAA